MATTLYDSGIRTPLIFHWPGRVKAGAVQPALVSVVDLAPTLLDLARVQQDTMQGGTLRGLFQDTSTRGRDLVFAEANWHDRYIKAGGTNTFEKF